MLSTALALTIGFQQAAPENQRNLDPKTRPYIELPQFKSLPCISVSEYRTLDEKGKQIGITRVYRFTFQAQFADQMKHWRSIYPAKEGWTAPEVVDGRCITERKLKHAKVKEQALLMKPGRLRYDTKQFAHTAIYPDAKGWVAISYNEVLTRTKW